MAKIEDLILQVPDDRLRKALAGEVKALKRTKKFGLVFEQHLPKTLRLPLLPVREGIWIRTCQHIDGWTDVPKVFRARVRTTTP